MDSIRTSIELGLAGEIDAVTTAPINKVAIKMVGVKQAGHTEIYMDEMCIRDSPWPRTA